MKNTTTRFLKKKTIKIGEKYNKVIIDITHMFIIPKNYVLLTILPLMQLILLPPMYCLFILLPPVNC